MVEEPHMNNHIKVLLLQLLFVLVVSCGPNIEDKITDAQLIGAISNVNVSIKEDKYKGGTAIIAVGVIPFDIKREQIKPTILAALKVLIRKYPDATGIFIRLAPDKDLAKYAYFAGTADYENNEITVDYKIPTDKQINDWNSEIGKPIELEGKSLGTNDSPRLLRFDKKLFDIATKVTLSYHKAQKQLANKYIDQPLKTASTQEIYHLVSGETGVSDKDAQYYRNLMDAYYGSTREKETISLK